MYFELVVIDISLILCPNEHYLPIKMKAVVVKIYNF